MTNTDEATLLETNNLLEVSLTDENNAVIDTVKLIPILPTKRSGIDEDASVSNSDKRLKIDSDTSTETKDPEFINLKTRLLRQINHTLPAEETKVFSYLSETRQEVSRILKQSIIQKESHSVIMVGPRNSYKSFLINNELKSLSKEHCDQFITIRLNGFIHSEQTAINGIASQLESELHKINKEDSVKTITDTNVSSGSLTEVFEKVLRLLDSTSSHQNTHTDASSKISVIFIFDEIDTFAGPVRQTLLYNLFDMVEHAMVPVCIFGNTSKLNVAEYLEKRVKSRFSQRIIYVPECKDLDEFVLTTKEYLSVSLPNKSMIQNPYMNEWNNFIEQLFQNESSRLFLEVRRNYETFKSLTTLKHSLIPLIHSCSTFNELKDAMTSCKIIHEYSMNQLQGGFSAVVQTLSELELAILIAAARTTLRNRDETTNFNLTYVEYSNMIKSLNARIPSTSNLNASTAKIVDNLVKLWSKEDIKNVWETLQDFNFITEKGDLGLRESAIAVFYASNYQFTGATIPFDLRIYNLQITLQDLRRIVSKASMFYSWTQL